MTTIVLAHGFPGFAKFGRLTYFRDVAAFLEDELGVKVLTPDVGPFGLIEERALKLKEAIEAESDRVHIIAHSAGGIDARYLISPEGLELADRAASVTTVSTPHQGASIAEAALGSLNFASLKELTSNSPEIDSDRMKRIRDSLLGAVQDRKGSFLPKMLGRFLTRMQGVFDSSLPFPSLESTKPEVSRLALGLFGVKELTVTLKVEIEQYTRKSMELFNKEHKVPGNVKFFSYAGASGPGEDDILPPIFYLSYLIVLSKEGPNDGWISVRSATRDTFRRKVPADHAQVVGHDFSLLSSLTFRRRFNHREFYKQIVEELPSS